jgi:hypothetical protein
VKRATTSASSPALPGFGPVTVATLVHDRAASSPTSLAPPLMASCGDARPHSKGLHMAMALPGSRTVCLGSMMYQPLYREGVAETTKAARKRLSDIQEAKMIKFYKNPASPAKKSVVSCTSDEPGGFASMVSVRAHRNMLFFEGMIRLGDGSDFPEGQELAELTPHGCGGSDNACQRFLVVGDCPDEPNLIGTGVVELRTSERKLYWLGCTVDSPLKSVSRISLNSIRIRRASVVPTKLPMGPDVKPGALQVSDSVARLPAKYRSGGEVFADGVHAFTYGRLVKEAASSRSREDEGDDKDKVYGCGSECTSSHSGGENCLVCRRPWSNHSGHNCQAPFSGMRGSWPSKDGKGPTVGCWNPGDTIVRLPKGFRPASKCSFAVLATAAPPWSILDETEEGIEDPYGELAWEKPGRAGR